MQLQKQARRAARKDTGQRTVKLKSFNPVIKPGLEITHAHVFGNMFGPTHVTYVVRRKE